ncbi:MAG: hypothetical protein KL839_03315 [Rhizobium sp.]|nr:hypothetical protein [Rhizobium sp.]
MCGIVGIVGTQPVAERLVDALEAARISRLRFGGRRHDRRRQAMDRRRAEGKLFNLEKLALIRCRADRHRPHALGNSRRAERNERPPAFRRWRGRGS